MILVIDLSVLRHACEVGGELCLACLFAILKNPNISVKHHEEWTTEFNKISLSDEVMGWKTEMQNARRFVASERGVKHPFTHVLDTEVKRHPRLCLLTMAYLSDKVVLYCALYGPECKQLTNISHPNLASIEWKEIHSTPNIEHWLTSL